MPFAIGMLAAAAALLVCAVIARGRAYALPKALVVEYSPVQPPARTAHVVPDAILVGRERRAVAAGLLELAVRRKVRLVAETSQRGRMAIGVELIEGAELSGAETELLEALFGPGHPRDRVRRFSKDRRAVGRRIRAYVEAQAKDLVGRRLIDGGTNRIIIIEFRGILRTLTWPVLLLAAAAAALTLSAQAWLVGALCTAALIAAIAALWITPPGERRVPTPSGQERQRHLDGLRQYMRLAEADRLRFLQSPDGALSRRGEGHEIESFVLDERLLPYAVVFGLEREWVAHLKIAYAELDRTRLAALGDLAQASAELLQVADALGSLVELGFAVGDLVDVGGSVVEVVGGVFDAVS